MDVTSLTGNEYLGGNVTRVVAPLSPEMVALKAATDKEANTSLVLYRNQIAQAEHEVALMKRVPEMKTQREALQARLAIMRRCVTASNAGFAEYHPAQSWNMGFLRKPDGVEGGFKLYTRAIPAQAIIAFNLAKDLKVFDQFTVHSPDPSAFTDYAPVVQRRIDPVLIGWVNTRVLSFDRGFRQLAPVENSDGRHPFLIAAWDLGADLAFAQTLLPTNSSA